MKKKTTAPSLILQSIVRNDALFSLKLGGRQNCFVTGFYTNHLRCFRQDKKQFLTTSKQFRKPVRNFLFYFPRFSHFFLIIKKMYCVYIYYTWYPPSAIVIITVDPVSCILSRLFFILSALSRITYGLIINLMDRWNIIRIPIIVKDERKAIFDCLA